MGTFSLGVSGLSAAQKNLSTIGNNIANASTIGFKKSRTEFADVYAQSGLGSSLGQAGNGVRVSNIAQQFEQGGTSFTQNTLDLAIDGNGFFIVKDANGDTSYTRAGMFGVDKEGNVVSSTGQTLQGYPSNANGDGISVGVVQALQIPQSNIAPNATTEINAGFNLDSRAEPPTNFMFDPNDSDTYTHLYPSVVYDSLGNSHTMTQYFVKQPPYIPEYGDHARAVQALMGIARYGTGYNNLPVAQYGSTGDRATFDDDGAFFGDSNEDATAGSVNLDADIIAILNTSGALTLDTTTGAITASVKALGDDVDGSSGTADAGEAGFAYTGAVPDPGVTGGSGAGVLEEDDLSDRLYVVKSALEGLIDANSGRIKEFYEGLYDAFTDYIPTVPTQVDVDAFNGALMEIESAVSDAQLAYSRIDIAAGRVRERLFEPDLASTTPALAADEQLYGLDVARFPTAARVGGAADDAAEIVNIRAVISDLIGELEARRDGSTFSWDTDSAGTPGNSATPDTIAIINAEPTSEEAGVYQLALNAINSIEVDWSSIDAAKETAINIMSALESESADNTWHMYTTIDGEQVTDGNDYSPDYYAFNFTEFGQLEEPVPKMFIKDWVPKDNAGDRNGSDQPQILEINLDGTTQFAGAFGANTLSQDGYATGELAGLDIDRSGVIIARYTNSQTQLIGQVALANFRNEQGLRNVGGTMWAASSDSGQPVINEPGVSVAGNIMSKALEDSNVDLSEELVKMIIAQRDYQANAKTLQTADTLTQTIINMR